MIINSLNDSQLHSIANYLKKKGIMFCIVLINLYIFVLSIDSGINNSENL